MKVLFTASEMAPWVKTGGLGDVCAALPAALQLEGVDMRVLIPAYPALKAAFLDAPIVATLPPLTPHMHGSAIRLARTSENLPLYLLECDMYFDRPGKPYHDAEGNDWSDNGLRYGLLSRVAALLASPRSPLEWIPDILHCNDWQTALAPVCLYYDGLRDESAKTVLTIHNLAFQGLFGYDLLRSLALPEHAWSLDGVEYHGALSFLKGGIQHATAITTVSPTYANEIQSDAEGMGMGGLLRYHKGKLTGIVNGIDTREWNSATDPHLVVRYDAKTLANKVKNTTALRIEFGLAQTPTKPLLGLVCRLTYQKGVDLLLPLAHGLVESGAQLAILGSGDKPLEAAFADMASRYPGRIAVRLGFDEGVAHRIEAGADLFLMPSRFEPCGLNQMYSLRYGTLPVVRATGGLADTVIDASDAERGNGFVFRDASPDALWWAIQRAVDTWRDKPTFTAMQKRAMAGDYSWKSPARSTINVYRSLLPAEIKSKK